MHSPLMIDGRLSGHIVVLKACANSVPRSGPNVIVVLIKYNFMLSKNCWRSSPVLILLLLSRMMSLLQILNCF